MPKRAKKVFVSDVTFAELMLSAAQALSYERGEREGYRVNRLMAPAPSQPKTVEKDARVHKKPD
jgi:hypothetical protein